jgi:hypothetical protein
MQIDATVGSPVSLSGQTVAIGAASAQSSAMNRHSGVVRLVATVTCFVEIGTNPTAAAATGMYLPAGVPEYFTVPQQGKVAVIQAVGAGSLYITEF